MELTTDTWSGTQPFQFVNTVHTESCGHLHFSQCSSHYEWGGVFYRQIVQNIKIFSTKWSTTQRRQSKSNQTHGSGISQNQHTIGGIGLPSHYQFGRRGLHSKGPQKRKKCYRLYLLLIKFCKKRQPFSPN